LVSLGASQAEYEGASRFRVKVRAGWVPALRVIATIVGNHNFLCWHDAKSDQVIASQLRDSDNARSAAPQQWKDCTVSRPEKPPVAFWHEFGMQIVDTNDVPPASNRGEIAQTE